MLAHVVVSHPGPTMSIEDCGPVSSVGPPSPVNVPDLQMRNVLRKLRDSGQPAYHVMGATESRARIARARELAQSGPALPRVEDLLVPSPAGGVPVRRYLPQASPKATVVYLHGGGWVVGGLDESDALCRTLAQLSECEVISVDYRLAPEHPFPAAVDDAEAAVTWVTSERSGPIILMGDSAGGNLATVAARRARDRGDSRVALQVLIYPVTDHRMNTRSYALHGELFLISASDMNWFWDCYVPDPAERASPDAAPILTPDLTGMPAAHFVIAHYDPLQDEALAYANHLADAGVAVTVDRYEAMVHGFLPLLGQVDTADEALASIAGAIRAAAL